MTYFTVHNFYQQRNFVSIYCIMLLMKLYLFIVDNADLNLRIAEDGYVANPITVEGFGFMWAGARANYGVKKGKICYEVKVVDELRVDHLPDEETSRHVVRLGFSLDTSSTQLG